MKKAEVIAPGNETALRELVDRSHFCQTNERAQWICSFYIHGVTWLLPGLMLWFGIICRSGDSTISVSTGAAMFALSLILLGCYLFSYFHCCLSKITEEHHAGPCLCLLAITGFLGIIFLVFGSLCHLDGIVTLDHHCSSAAGTALLAIGSLLMFSCCILVYAIVVCDHDDD